jgi:hypothetical protein
LEVGALREQLPSLVSHLQRDQQLLALEAITLSLRSPSFRKRVAPALRTIFDAMARKVAADRGAAQPSKEDRYTAVGLFGAISFGHTAGATFMPAEDLAAATTYLAERLLPP